MILRYYLEKNEFYTTFTHQAHFFLLVLASPPRANKSQGLFAPNLNRE